MCPRGRGNFTSLGGVEAQGIALWNPNTTQITPLPGLSGRVSSVYCDSSSATVYVGGSFTGANSTNAIAWTTGWTNLPFAGFNGPVTSITKASNGNIIFGGQFDGLGNTTTPKVKDGQVVNVGSANITSASTTTQSGFNDPRNIICKTGDQDGSGNTWLLADNTPGFWQANFSFGFNPTKIRLYNTKHDGRGTKTWRFTALPINGIMNMTYIDSNGHNASCSATCPLPQDNSTYRDFHLVNPIGMNAFRLDISDWYGSGGGLAGVELFQDDIYTFAINDFNEPQCDHVSTGASSTATGPWERITSGQSTSDYLTAYLTDSNNGNNSAQVVFQPDIKQSGNYSITVYTPGCMQDNSCATRGIVNITGTMTTENNALTTTLYQTNNYDKYDQVYYGYVDVDSGSFRPSVTLSPVVGQNMPLTVVAQRVRFELQTSTGGLNGIYEYNPNEAVVSTDFSTSAIDTAGMSLNTYALVNALAVHEGTVYAVGNFQTDGISNVFSVGSQNATSLPGGGLNAEVLTMYQNDTMLYMGGNFTNTANNASQGINGVVSYSIQSNSWQPLGAGVNGPVWAIVPLQLNVTANVPETVVTVNGDFSEVNGFDNNAAFSAAGFAIWVPSRSNWLHNLQLSTISINGQLITYTDVPGFTPLYAGAISSQDLGISDAVGLTGSGQPTLQSLGLNIQPNQQTSGSLRKRATGPNNQNITGVAAGLYYNQGGMNITVLGGHFSANASDGSAINNLLFLNNTGSQHVSGLPSTVDSASTFLAMDTQGSTLFAGGTVTGTASGNNLNGMVVYDLSAGALAATQPPPLAGNTVSVNAIAAQPNAPDVYVGGSFSNAGSLNCPSLCVYDTQTSQWNSPGTGLSGPIAAMTWASNTHLIIAGNITVGGNATTMATYDARAQTFTEFTGASDLPGPVSALVVANSAYDQFWVAGTATNNNTAYLEKYDGKNWIPVSGLGAATSIRGLQVLSLTANHAASTLVDRDEVLLITGVIDVPNFGNASAVLFNGTTFQPFLLTGTASNGQGV
ncbi:hypothetical protein H2203_004701 [Taxawa tesnikishii (nom. ined.)]|nr:hypothetical protein H2203_004701 [Dothideales sp. JES 119]